MYKKCLYAVVLALGLFVGGCAIPDTANANYVPYVWSGQSPWWPWYAPRTRSVNRNNYACSTCVGGQCGVTKTEGAEQKEGEKAVADTPPKLPAPPVKTRGCCNGWCNRR